MPKGERGTPLGRFLETELKRLDKNWAWLADQVGVSTAAVAKWPKTGQISRTNIPRVATALGRSVDEIYAAIDGVLEPAPDCAG